MLPPPAPKIAPHPATRAQLYQPQPEGEQPTPAPEAAPAEHHPAHHAAGEQSGEGGGRSSIEQWMSDLRTSRRSPGKPDEDDAKHRGGEGRQVSVNELLRRQNND